MAYNDYMDYGVGAYETEEERRKRLAEEAAAREAANAPDNIDVGGGFNPAGGSATGFMDKLGTYAQRRFDRAVEPFTNPEAAFNRRLGMAPEEAANTEVQSQTVKTYADGSQEEVTKKQIPAAPVAPAVQPAPQTQMATPAALAAPVAPGTAQTQDPAEIQRRAEALRAMTAQQARPVAPQAEAAPQTAAAPAAPINPNAPPPAVGQLPQFGPGVQVASTEPSAGVAEAVRAAQAVTPTGEPVVGAPQGMTNLAQGGAQAQAAPAPAPAVAAAPAEPAWIREANDAGSDFGKLVAIAGRYPESQKAIQAKLEGIVENTRKAREADDLIRAAQSGDVKAMNKLEQAMRPTRGKEREEVTVTDYLKAYMYARLGLNDLSQEVQAKISGKDTKFGQIQLGDTTWSVETNAKTGEIVRAKDDEGNIATQNTLNKLAAAGQKFGTQAYSQTGEIHITPDNKQVVKVFNATTGKTQWTDVATGDKWTGQGTPRPQSISTAAAKTDYNLAADLFKKHSGNVIDMLKEYEMIKGPLSDEGRGQFLRQYGYGGTISTPAQATGGAAPAAPAPAAPVAPTAQRPGAAPAVQTTPAPAPGVQPTPTPAVSTAPIATGGRVSGGVSTGGISGMKTAQEIGKAGAIENIQVQGARSKAFNEILDTEVRPQAQAGDTVSSIRKQQFAIFDRPGIDANKLFGLYNAAQEAPGDQKLSIIRDIFGGVFKPEAEVSQRLANLNLSPTEKSALMEYNIANQQINAATLKRTAGAGSVSDAEQKANRESNVDPTKIPALGAYNAMAQSQFDADKARWKADWASGSRANNALELDREWRKESQRLSKIYQDISTQRIKFINANGNTYNAVREGYRKFPVPEYDPESSSWKKTKPLGAILGGQ